MLQRPQVLQRVLTGDDEVLALAHFQRAGHAPYPGQPGVAQGGGVQGKLVAHSAILVEVAQLPPEVVLGDVRAAHVVAKAHRDAVGQRRFGAFHDAVKHDPAVVLVFFRRTGHRRVKQRIRQRRGNGGAQERAVLLVQFYRFFVHFCAVLDGIHAVFQRHLHPFGRFGVGRHGIAHGVGLIAHGLYHLRRHLQLAGGALFGGIQHAAGDHQFDKVHPLGAGLGELGQGLAVVVGRHSHRACHVAARHRDALVGGQNARGQDLPGLGIVPAAGVKIRDAAHGADGGHAAQQLQLCIAAHHAVGHRTGQAVAQNFTHQRRIIPRLCAGLAVAGQMHMQVDEARHRIAAVEVDDLIAVQVGALVRNGGDDAVLAQQHLVCLRLHLLGAVQQNAIDICPLHGRFLAFVQPWLFFVSV